MTFGQLLTELQNLKKEDAKLLETPVRIYEADSYTDLALAVTLPGRQLVFIPNPIADEDAS